MIKLATCLRERETELRAVVPRCSGLCVLAMLVLVIMRAQHE
jgi:hypothetical protein